MEYLQSLFENSTWPIFSAFILGLMTAISPCPLATNITAASYVARNITARNKVLMSGVLYSLGRAFSYTSIGLILYLGASKFHLARFFNQNGEKILGPLLIIIGLVMLDLIKLRFSGGSGLGQKISEKFKDKGLLGSFVLGILFALAFCPYSAALFFGILIPMSIADSNGLYLPVIFAIGTGLPVILFTYLLAFAVSKIGLFYERIAAVEQWVRRITGIVFVLAGLYYLSIFLHIL